MITNYIKQERETIIHIENIRTIIYMGYPKNYVFEGEKHDFWEFIYVDQGRLLITADDKKFILNTEEIAFHKPEEFHAIKNLDPNFFVCIVSFDCSSPEMSFFKNKYFKLSMPEKNIIKKIIEYGKNGWLPGPSDQDNCTMLVNTEAEIGARQLTYLLIEQFFLLLLQNNQPRKNNSDQLFFQSIPESFNDIVENAIRYMKENLNSSLPIKTIAQALAVNESTLKKAFMRIIHKGITETFNELKLEEAKRLMRETDLNCTQISEKLGFNSIHYFSRLFKKKTQLSPLQYKKSIGLK